MYTDDPVADYEAWDSEQQKILDKLPRCSECDEPIRDEYAFYINDDWICEECMGDYRKEVPYER